MSAPSTPPPSKWEKMGDIAAAQEAITLYRGSLLEGFDAPFLEGERAAREQTCLTLLEAVASHALTQRRPRTRRPPRPTRRNH